MLELPIHGPHKLAVRTVGVFGSAAPTQPQLEAGAEVNVLSAWAVSSYACALITDADGRYAVVSVGALERVEEPRE